MVGSTFGDSDRDEWGQIMGDVSPKLHFKMLRPGLKGTGTRETEEEEEEKAFRLSVSP